MLDARALEKQLDALIDETRERISTTDRRSNYLIVPRPIIKVTVTGPNGKTVTYGPFRTKTTVMHVVYQYARRALDCQFSVRAPAESEGL